MYFALGLPYNVLWSEIKPILLTELDHLLVRKEPNNPNCPIICFLTGNEVIFIKYRNLVHFAYKNKQRMNLDLAFVIARTHVEIANKLTRER